MSRDASPDEVFAAVEAELPPGPHDLLIYLHVPFCPSKCHFCDFVADLDTADLRSGPPIRARYVAALQSQIRAYAPKLAAMGYQPKRIYWGGGTPSQLNADELVDICRTLNLSFDMSSLEEHSFEANPDSLTLEKVSRLVAEGVNRVSIGVQSFNDEELARAGRAHSAQDAVDAARAIRGGGITNFNIDLIAGLTGQSDDDLKYSLDTCISLEPMHVTVYNYRPDKRTVMGRQIKRGDRPTQYVTSMLRAFDIVRSRLTAAGYEEYALGYFAREGKRFLGESYYFELTGDYIGFGSGSVSILGHHIASNTHKTFHRFRDDPLTFESYGRYAPQRFELLTRELRLALLMWNGIDYARFERLFGFPFATMRELPAMRRYLEYFENCGAEFVEDSTGLRVTDETKLTAHLRTYEASHLYTAGARQ
ncbi:hypothetical protein Lesp02_08860 [Lentzea sp. NBRC 105346]|nr:hypothetical protein Lesp02_08860 [Lentzea sp. NBRC 105346]